jgi:hypothetical protein|tara:strand:+ start:58 stop:339 length:282 start_codon:yes stop_codon:yes gene_type:complete
MKKIIIPVCLLLASCNQAYYRHYLPYLQVGSDIELIKDRIELDEKMGYITPIRADDYLKQLEIIKFKVYNVSYKAKKPILMPLRGRNMTTETW